MIFKSIVLLSTLYLVESQFVSGVGYHEVIGIRKAAALRQSEGGVVRIVGGTKVPEAAAVPYYAGIIVTLTTGWTSICGGALISRTRVLTAAHCWFDGKSQAKQFTIVLGSLTIFSGGTRITTSNVVVHPSWDTKEIIFDIAMITIAPVDYNNAIQAIPLPTMSEVDANFAGMAATASGFGKTSDGQNNFPTTTALHYVNLNIISNAECQKSFEISIHGSHLCTSGKGKVGTCDGDSGGPLTLVRNLKRVLVGIVSFGLGDACQSGYPSVFTRVTAFLTWIHSQM